MSRTRSTRSRTSQSPRRCPGAAACSASPSLIGRRPPDCSAPCGGSAGTPASLPRREASGSSGGGTESVVCENRTKVHCSMDSSCYSVPYRLREERGYYYINGFIVEHFKTVRFADWPSECCQGSNPVLFCMRNPHKRSLSSDRSNGLCVSVCVKHVNRTNSHPHRPDVSVLTANANSLRIGKHLQQHEPRCRVVTGSLGAVGGFGCQENLHTAFAWGKKGCSLGGWIE